MLKGGGFPAGGQSRCLGHGEPGSGWLVTSSPHGPPTGRGLTPLGALSLSLPSNRLEGTGRQPGPRKPRTGSGHWPHWAEPLLTVGCRPGKRGQGKWLPAP